MDKHEKAKKGMKFFAYFFLIMTVATTAATVIGNISKSNSVSDNQPLVVEHSNKEWIAQGAWEPEMMFIGNAVLGKGMPLIIGEDSYNFAGVEKTLKEIKYIKDLEKGQKVYHLVLDEEEVPFILLTPNRAILQKGKLGFSFNRSSHEKVMKQIESLKSDESGDKEKEAESLTE